MDLKEKVMDKVEDVIESIDGDELCESVAVELHLDFLCLVLQLLL